jgi:hypothetical protein
MKNLADAVLQGFLSLIQKKIRRLQQLFCFTQRTQRVNKKKLCVLCVLCVKQNSGVTFLSEKT